MGVRRRWPAVISDAENPGTGPGTAGGLALRNVSKVYRSGGLATAALEDVEFTVERGQFATLIGPSGCGKSTVLRIVAGLVEADDGEVAIFGESVREACARKHIGYVPQSAALLPWRTVLDNVRLPLQVNRGAGGNGADAARDPVEILTAFGLGGVLDRRPSQLSGGMAQRVAIARAFAFDPPVLLMDEPFSSLDELTREVLRHELLELWSAHRTTVLFVTHSVAEAVLLSDVVLVMSPQPGRIRAAVPIDIPRPRGEFVELSDEFRDLERQVRIGLRVGDVAPPGVR